LQFWHNSRLLPAQASDAEADDGNLDACCLCGLGGNLLCCDGCPAAYHMRCIGEGAKSIPDGEWLCTECSLGGRGEPPSCFLTHVSAEHHHPWGRTCKNMVGLTHAEASPLVDS
jgi:PHD-finger